MSSQANTLLSNFKRLIPPLTEALHKGQAGRIAVVGGSEDYTGAPFFAGIASLKIGADLCHVFCEKNAGLVIKSYSPELMVHPYLRHAGSLDHDASDRKATAATIDKIVERVTGILPRLHVLVIGPGLSRDDVMIESTKRIMQAAKEKKMSMVIDAQDPNIIKGYSAAVLTPNINEFKRLCEAMKVDVENAKLEDQVKKLSEAFGNVTIVAKGKNDIISNGKDVVICDNPGSPRRCGGQGDLLSGSIATFLAWGKGYENKAWDHSSDSNLDQDLSVRLPLTASWAACRLIRDASRRAFGKHGRSMTTTDMIAELGEVFRQDYEKNQKDVVADSPVDLLNFFISVGTPFEKSGAICEALVLSVPAPNAAVGLPTITYGLNGKFYGPTPVCSSVSTSESTTVIPVTTNIAAETEIFRTVVPAEVTGTAANGEICFTATASPACPSGYATATAANAGFVATAADYNVQGVQTLAFGVAPATAACPEQTITVSPNFTPTGTVICATPSAGPFPGGFNYQSGQFTATATYTADSFVCTSMSTSTSTIYSTLTTTGAVGATPIAVTTYGTTNVGGQSASATVCAPTPTVQPAGSCPTSYTSYSVTGTTSYTVTPTFVATGTKTSGCTTKAVTYTLGV
ncbi:hypothetical protein HDV00_004679 [Rhizophlyctis rosea]|nr:hypothetical protein HDV00_004679 [Rhizophlyctis rosea]